MKARGGECNASYVEITQTPTGAKAPSGSPISSVDILNECPTNCQVAELYLNCGYFKSDQVIPPLISKLLGPSDCLVKNGMPIASGAVVTFEYASPQKFPLSVSSLKCLG